MAEKASRARLILCEECTKRKEIVDEIADFYGVLALAARTAKIKQGA